MYTIFDFGGSHIKIYQSETKTIQHIKNYDEKIINLDLMKYIIKNNITDKTDYIGISSQMHGLVIYDENNNNISDFITWKQESENNIFDVMPNEEFYLTGLKPRLDLPINNLYDWIIKNNIINTTLKIKNITEALLDTTNNITHSTMACGTGFYDIKNKMYVDKYINFFKQTFNINLIFDNVVENNDISGYLKKNNKLIKSYVGIGDFQSSILGCKLKTKELLLNLATGSQIALISNNFNNDKLSYRPYFNNKYIKCITHIPSGRFLNIYEKFFKDMNINIWDEFDKLKLVDFETVDMLIKTNIFNKDGLAIENINIHNFNYKNMIKSILYAYVWQYISMIKKYKFNFDTIKLSGGIGKKV